MSWFYFYFYVIAVVAMVKLYHSLYLSDNSEVRMIRVGNVALLMGINRHLLVAILFILTVLCAWCIIPLICILKVAGYFSNDK